MKKNNSVDEIDVWVKKYLAQDLEAEHMKENVKAKIIDEYKDKGYTFEILDDESLDICEQLSEIGSKFDLAIDLSGFFSNGYEVLLAKVANEEPENRVYIMDAIEIDSEHPYAKTDYRILTRNKIKEFADLFLLDAWEPEALINYEFVFVIKDPVLYKMFSDVINNARLHSPISVVKYECK